MQIAVVGTTDTAAHVASTLEGGDVEIVSVAAAGDIPSGVDLVLEAVDGSLEDKQQALIEIDGSPDASVLVASSNRLYSVTELSSAVTTPERFVGVRFVEDTELVEVVSALATSDQTMARVRDLLISCGRQVVSVGDRPGFLVDRLLLPYLNQAINEFDGGIAELDDIDTSVKLGLGYPSGPFEVLDRVGVDRHLEATEAVYERTGEHQYAPPPLLQRMAAAGWTGADADRGFHDKEGSHDA